MISNEDFSNVLQGLARTLPRHKSLDAMSLTLAWVTLDERVKNLLTRDILVYAAAQRMLDPDPDTEQPLHIALLGYVFRNENGKPNLEWGLKLDLPSRMKNIHRFNPEPVRGQVVIDETISPHGVLNSSSEKYETIERPTTAEHHGGNYAKRI